MKNKKIKSIFFDTFLRYQFTVCTAQSLPLTHYVPILFLSLLTDSFYYLYLYIFSILFITGIMSLSVIFPDAIGTKYTGFLKRHSTEATFLKYCGNPGSAIIKALGIVGKSELAQAIVKNGGKKIIYVIGGVVAAQHGLHKAKVGQLYEYHVEKGLNNGVHPFGVPPSKMPFVFKENGPSWADQAFKYKK